VRPVKRLEIIVDSPELDEIIKLIESANVTGYTIIRDVLGRGDRGPQFGFALSGAFSNCYILVACEPETATALVEMVRPILTRRGGVCLVSDAEWVRH